MIGNILAVGAGGFLGSVLRYLFGQLSKFIAPGLMFPVGTFLVNILGAFFIGIAFEFFSKQGLMGSTMQLFIMVGIMGGFTTFSSFSLETVNLISSGRLGLAFIYAAGSVFICLVGVWLGKTII
ncbi:fluoride efflux transporter CrcB [Aminipila terrae]|uniref:Fluoride-specific ion channel FluC n=1 Tax=Aminipila terrae TaxID=2697030 RepID=A0A6P1MP25_9FIRM|nr:fluoride efflux transporter CrcB [Aminipila terrae]QHI72745.1 fluoride efflux transporter CrcB [Aminipila terrae]